MIWDGRLLADLVYYANQVVFCDLQGLELHIIKIKKKRLRCSRDIRVFFGFIVRKRYLAYTF